MPDSTCMAWVDFHLPVESTSADMLDRRYIGIALKIPSYGYCLRSNKHETKLRPPTPDSYLRSSLFALVRRNSQGCRDMVPGRWVTPNWEADALSKVSCDIIAISPLVRKHVAELHFTLSQSPCPRGHIVSPFLLWFGQRDPKPGCSDQKRRDSQVLLDQRNEYSRPATMSVEIPSACLVELRPPTQWIPDG